MLKSVFVAVCALMFCAGSAQSAGQASDYTTRLGQCQSAATDCPAYYQCLLNCPFKYTDPAACEFICQDEVC